MVFLDQMEKLESMVQLVILGYLVYLVLMGVQAYVDNLDYEVHLAFQESSKFRLQLLEDQAYREIVEILVHMDQLENQVPKVLQAKEEFQEMPVIQEIEGSLVHLDNQDQTVSPE